MKGKEIGIMLVCEACGIERTVTYAAIKQHGASPHCRLCGLKKAIALKPKRSLEQKKQYRHSRYQATKADRDAYCTAWRKARRLELIAQLGGKCEWCSETDPIVLDFDHRADDANLDRIGGKKPKNKIYLVQERPERFQLLCKNCNWRKEHNRRQRAIKERTSG